MKSSVSSSSAGTPTSNTGRSAAVVMSLEEAFLDGDDVAWVDLRVEVHTRGRLGRVVLAYDEDLFLRGALPEAARNGDGFSHVQTRNKGIGARSFHLAVDEEIAVFVDRDGDLRIDEVAPFQPLADDLLEFADGLARKPDLAKDWVRDRRSVR